ncbi:MAG: single-stranded DNA-binding protein [Minisyncoccia bacterium]|jgi:single-strand DNA-binding protein
MNLNKAFILGNLTRDPELRQTTTGQSVCSFGVATNSFYTDKSGQKQKKAEFHNVVVWGRQAEIVNQFLKKGSSILVEGRLQTRSWQDKQGQTHRTTEIISERIQLGPRSAGGGQFGGNVSADKPEEAREEPLPEINIEEGEIKPEEIPF